MGRASQDPWSIDYQCKCNAAALDSGLARPDGERGGLFTVRELKWMGKAFAQGMTAAQFVAFVRTARERGGIKSATFHTSRPNG